MTTQVDDELDQDQEEDKKKPIGKPITGPQKPAVSGEVPIGGGETSSIGSPITPVKPPAGDAPGVAPTPEPSMAPKINSAQPQESIGSPINIAPPMTPRPEYHGLHRVLDTLGGATKIGSAIEAAGGLGTEGWRQKNADEEKQIKQGEEQRKTNADVENTGAEAGLRTAQAGEAEQRGKAVEAASSNVIITDPLTGHTLQVPAKDAAAVYRQIIGQEGAGQRTQGTNQTRENIAGGAQQTQKDIDNANNLRAVDLQRMRTASAERIAQGKNLTSTEVARIHAAAVNDPNKLTNTMKTMKQQAQSTLPFIDKAMDETEKVAQLLGPGEGRWNDFMQGKIGVSDPAFAHYKDEIGMVSTAVTLAHARGRMSNELFEHFQQMFDAGKQAPENMIAALQVAQEWLGEYAKMGDPGSPQNPGTGAPGAPSNTTPHATGGGGFAQWKASQGKH